MGDNVGYSEGCGKCLSTGYDKSGKLVSYDKMLGRVSCIHDQFEKLLACLSNSLLFFKSKLCTNLYLLVQIVRSSNYM